MNNNKMRSVNFIIPSNLDIELLLDKHDGDVEINGYSHRIINGRKVVKYELKRYKPKTLKKYIKYCYWLLNRLWIKRLYNEQYSSNTAFINLSRESMRELIPDRSIDITKNLLEYFSIIEINNKYSTDNEKSFPKSYRLTELYRDELAKIYSLTDSDAFKIKIMDREKKRVWLDSFPKEILYQHDQLSHIQFDTEEAMNLLQSLFDEGVIGANQYNHWLAGLIPFIDSRYHFKWNEDSSHHRLYHSINTMSSMFRPLLRTTSGHRFVNIDFSSSVPTHLYTFLSSVLEDETDLEVDKDKLAKELDSYKGLIENGTLYQTVQESLTTDEHYVSLGDAKLAFLKNWLNTKEEYENDVSKTIANIFPEITSIKNQIRAIGENDLFNLLLKSEAKLVTRMIANRLIQELENPVFFTIHDAILIEELYADRAMQIILEEADMYLGLNARVKVDELERNTTVKQSLLKKQRERLLAPRDQYGRREYPVEEFNRYMLIQNTNFKFLDTRDSE